MFDFLSKKILNFFLNRPAVSAILINFIIIIFIPAVTLKKNVSEIKNYQVFPVEIISIAQKDELIRSQENYDENNEKLDNHPKNLKKTNVIESELLDYEKKTIKGFLNLNESLKIDDNNYEYSEPENIAANVGEKKNSENNYGSAIKNIEIPVQYSNIEKKTNNVFEERQFSEHEVEYKPVVIKKIKPVYPFMARELNKEGKVKLNFVVTKKGVVEKIEVMEEEPSGLFAESAVSALKKWKFIPGKIGGIDVDTKMTVDIKFEFDK